MKSMRLIHRNAILALSLIASISVSAQTVPGDNLLAEIDRAIDSARARIATFHVAYETKQRYSRNTKDNALMVSTNQFVYQWNRGDECRIDSVRSQEVVSASDGSRNFGRLRSYLRSQNYRAQWDRDGEFVKPLNIWVSDDFEFTRAHEERDSAAHLFDITRFAYTPYMANALVGPFLRERRPVQPSEYAKARFVETEEGEHILYEFYDRRDESRPVMSATLDPGKGYVFTKLRYDNEFIYGKEAGYFRYEWDAEYDEVGDGIWLPSSIRLFDARYEHETEIEISVLSCEVNTDVADELFRWSGMEYPGEAVFVTDASGLRRELTVWDIDESVVPETPYTEPVWVKMNEVIYPHLPPEEAPVSLVSTSADSPPPSIPPVEAAPPATAPGPEASSARVTLASRIWLAAVALGVVLVFGAGWTLYRKRS